MLSDEEKNSMELDIEAKYVGRTEKEFLNNVTYAECLYILDTKNKYCDDIKNLSLLKIVDIVNEQSKEIEELNKSDESKEQSSMKYYNLYKELVDKIKAKIEEYKKDGKIINQTMPYCGEYINHFEIKALQSLLEKE